MSEVLNKRGSVLMKFWCRHWKLLEPPFFVVVFFLFWRSYNTGMIDKGFPDVSDGKESICNTGDLDSIPGLGRPLEEGMATHSSILAYRIPMDRGA